LAIYDAAIDYDFEFFANLILHNPPMSPEVREVAAEVLLKLLNGEWRSKRAHKTLLTWKKFEKMSVRVCDLKEKNGLESAVTQTADEFQQSPRRVWDAWMMHLYQEEATEKLASELGTMRELGLSKKDIDAFETQQKGLIIREIKRRLNPRLLKQTG
jgi:hypothetical protein